MEERRNSRLYGECDPRKFEGECFAAVTLPSRIIEARHCTSGFVEVHQAILFCMFPLSC